MQFDIVCLMGSFSIRINIPTHQRFCIQKYYSKRHRCSIHHRHLFSGICTHKFDFHWTLNWIKGNIENRIDLITIQLYMLLNGKCGKCWLHLTGLKHETFIKRIETVSTDFPSSFELSISFRIFGKLFHKLQMKLSISGAYSIQKNWTLQKRFIQETNKSIS